MTKTAAREDTLKLVEALAGIRQFLTQAPEAQTPEILLKDIGGITGCALVPGNQAGITFNLTDSDGKVHQCFCDPAAFAFLLLVIVLGQSVFIDWSSKATGKPYIKVFGKADASAGTVFARVLVDCEERETVVYIDDDSLNLRHRNLTLGRSNPRSKRDTADWFAKAQAFARDVPDEVLPGTKGQKGDAAKALLHALRGLVADERHRLLNVAA